jgi:hypothetical protein
VVVNALLEHVVGARGGRVDASRVRREVGAVQGGAMSAKINAEWGCLQLLLLWAWGVMVVVSGIAVARWLGL